MQTAVASGSILGPMMGGYFSSWFGMRLSFFVASCCLGLATVNGCAFLFEMCRTARKNRKQKSICGRICRSLCIIKAAVCNDDVLSDPGLYDDHSAFGNYVCFAFDG